MSIVSLPDVWAVATRDTLDQARAYACYCLLGGDAAKTARMMRTSPEVIESLAHDHQWGKDVRVDLSVEGNLEGFQRLNRIDQYLVAEKARAIVNALVDKLNTPDGLERMVMKVSPTSGDVSFDPKAVESLIKSLAAIGDITYRALGDEKAMEAAGREADRAASTALDIYDRLQKRFPSKVEAIITTATVVKETPKIDVG